MSQKGNWKLKLGGRWSSLLILSGSGKCTSSLQRNAFLFFIKAHLRHLNISQTLLHYKTIHRSKRKMKKGRKKYKWYSRTPHNPYRSVDRPGYGLSGGMGLRGCAKNRVQKIGKKEKKIGKKSFFWLSSISNGMYSRWTIQVMPSQKSQLSE